MEGDAIDLLGGMRKMVVIVDGDNISIYHKKALTWKIDYGKLLAFLQQRFQAVPAFVGYYYSFGAKKDEESWETAKNSRYGFELAISCNGVDKISSREWRETVDEKGRERIKGSNDVEIATDMLWFTINTEAEVVVLLSGDSDFAPMVTLIRKCRPHIKFVVVGGKNPRHLSDGHAGSFDEVLYLEDLEQEIKFTNGNGPEMGENDRPLEIVPADGGEDTE